MFYIYIIIILLCLAVSLRNEAARRSFLWLYFAVVVVTELLIHLDLLSKRNYNWINFIYISYFFFYYLKETTKKKIHLIVWMFCVVISFIFLFKKNIFGVNSMIFQSFIYMYLSLNWLILQIQIPDKTAIYHKITFWVSTSILLWSVVFLMRMIPAYFLDNNDKNFLGTLSSMYQTITIFSYLLFLKGLFCKK